MNRVLKQGFSIDYTYNINFTEHLFTKENTLLLEFLEAHKNSFFQQKILFVIDEGVWNSDPDLGSRIKAYFSDVEFLHAVAEPLILKGGETCKNDPEALAAIIEAVDRFGIDRHSYLIGIGGGAILDLVGYAAAISHRGVRHIRIPTTVLAQNDSGVGVKNSVNYKGKKNFLGTFTPPMAVFNDYHFLQSLDRRSWLSGISEAIKVALIKDISFYNWIDEHVDELINPAESAMKELIFRCADLHLEHIRNGDPFELGSSRPLDFGHWSAHKLEQMTDFSVLHGEAVAVGIALDVVYSYLIGNISSEEAYSIVDLIRRLGLPIFHEVLATAQGKKNLRLGLNEFQEHLGGRLTIVLLEKVGKGKDYHHIDFDVVLKAIDFLAVFQTDNNLIHED